MHPSGAPGLRRAPDYPNRSVRQADLRPRPAGCASMAGERRGGGRYGARGRALALGAALGAGLGPAAALAYPGGTPSFQTDVAPYCAACHSSRSAEALAGTGQRADRELAETKHLARLLAGEEGYASLSEPDRESLAKLIRALDVASTVTLVCPDAVAPGSAFEVAVEVTGGGGPVAGIGLVDAAHRWWARPAASAGWQVVAPPRITGPDGAP